MKKMITVEEEFDFYIKTHLPNESINAWFETLSSEDQERVRSHLSKYLNSYAAVFTDMAEKMRNFGAETIQGVISGFEKMGIEFETIQKELKKDD